MLATICFVLAALFFFLGLINFTFNTGNPPKPHSYNWMSGGFMWWVLALYIVALIK